MASSYSSSEIFEFQANAKALEEWDANEGDADFIAHCKKAVQVAVDRELTGRQRQVYLLYYLDGISIPQIAGQFGVNKSSVSRMLRRANEKLARVMRYAAPHLLHAQAVRRNRRDKNVMSAM